MAYEPIQIANQILVDHPDTQIDPLKLQKLVYFANGWWLALTGSPLVSEEPQVWRHGPVFRSLYRAFSRYKWMPIVGPEPSNPFGGAPALVTGADSDRVKTFLNWIWNEYGSQTGVDLSELTHAEGTPWRTIAKKSDFTVPANTAISSGEDWAYFAEMVKARGWDVQPLRTA